MWIVIRKLSNSVVVSGPDEATQLPAQVPASIPANFGGVSGDYEVIEVTAQQAAQIRANFPAKSTLISGTVAARPLPLIAGDKNSIVIDGLDAAAITVTVDDNTHTGRLWWTVDFPEGNQLRAEDGFVAGQATLILTTEQHGTHRIEAAALEYGNVSIQVEGID